MHRLLRRDGSRTRGQLNGICERTAIQTAPVETREEEVSESTAPFDPVDELARFNQLLFRTTTARPESVGGCAPSFASKQPPDA